MMYNSPFFTFPYNRNFSKKNGYSYLKGYYPNNNYLSNKIYSPNYTPSNYHNEFYTKNVQKNNCINSKNNSSINFKNIEDETHEKDDEKKANELFEIFGIKLYFDDILLICLIFFLYNEGVKDYYLFISLILFLLS